MVQNFTEMSAKHRISVVNPARDWDVATVAGLLLI